MGRGVEEGVSVWGCDTVKGIYVHACSSFHIISAMCTDCNNLNLTSHYYLSTR